MKNHYKFNYLVCNQLHLIPSNWSDSKINVSINSREYAKLTEVVQNKYPSLIK